MGKEKTDSNNLTEKPHSIPVNYLAYLALLLCVLIGYALFAWSGVKVNIAGLELRHPKLPEYAKNAADTVPLSDSTFAEALTFADSIALSVIEEVLPIPDSSVLPQPIEQGTSVAVAEAEMVALNDTAASVQSSLAVSENLAQANDSTPKKKGKLLLIGDSMTEHLRTRLRDYGIKNGYDIECVIWYGSTTAHFGTCDTLAYFIRKYRPSFVMLALGSNELFIKDIREKRDGYVKHIVSQMGRTPFLWIAPPNWKEDTGINDMILENVGASRYYESRKLHYTRASDGAHPTRESAYQWMDSIAVFMNNNPRFPVEMTFPDIAEKKNPHTVILKMVRK